MTGTIAATIAWFIETEAVYGNPEAYPIVYPECALGVAVRQAARFAGHSLDRATAIGAVAQYSANL